MYLKGHHSYLLDFTPAGEHLHYTASSRWNVKGFDNYKFLQHKWNELEAAQQHVQTGLELSQAAEGVGLFSNGYIPLARIYQVQGQTDKAINCPVLDW